MEKKILDIEVLRTKYILEDKTVKQLSEELGVCTQVITAFLKAFNLKKTPKCEFVDKETLQKLHFDENLSMRRIAELYQVSSGSVRGAFSHYNILPKTREQAHGEYTRSHQIIVICGFCGKPVTRKISRLKKTSLSFCDSKCSHEYQARDRGIPELPESWRRKRHYKTWRNSVLRRDGNCCKLCGDSSALVAHHILEARDCPDKRLDLNNGITFCKKCHIKIHKEGSHNFIKPLQEAILVENSNIGGNLEIDNTEATVITEAVTTTKSIPLG